MNIPTFINDQGIETYIKPWHRPELVDWEPVELPPWADGYQPTSVYVECCCAASYGFSGAFPATPVPELSTSTLVLIGVLAILLIKWRT